MSNIDRTRKSSPCPCCSDTKGKCGVTDSKFDTPHTSNKMYVEGDLVFCMSLREDTDTHKFTGETSNRLWGKFISWELSEELSQEWKTEKTKKVNGIQKPKISDSVESYKKRRSQKFEQEKIDRTRWQKLLLDEDNRDLAIRKVLGDLSISDRDYKSIKQRGFSRDDIFDFEYKSVQVEQPLSEGVSPFLAGVKKDSSGLNNKVSGLLLPIKNNRQKYVGWQYRPNISGNAKYYWPKSKIENRDYNITSHQKDSLEIPLAYCLPKGEVTSDFIGLTEGAGFKPQLTAMRQAQVVLGAAGGLFASSPKTFADSLKSASKITGNKDVVIYPDAGVVENPNMLRVYSNTVDFLKDEGYSVKIGWWDQTSKDKHLDIDEIPSNTNIQMLEPNDFFKLGKHYSNWHPADEKKYRDTSKVQINEHKIAKKMSEKLLGGIKAQDKEQIEKVITQYKERYKDTFDSLKKIVWNDFLSENQQSQLKTLLTSPQQEQVEKIAPILVEYLNLNEKYSVENSKTKIEYNPDSKTLQYQNKENPSEHLLAKFEDGKWQDKGSKISQEKESYFLNEAAAKIEELKNSKNQSIGETSQLSKKTKIRR